MSAQAAAARTPGAKRAGPGEYVFDLGKVNHIKGGPDYSSVVGGVVEGDRMIVALMRMPAGTGAEPHSHPNEQWIYILEGTFKAKIGDDEVEAKPGSVVYVPSNVVHSAKATADGDVVFFTVKDASHSLHGVKADVDQGGTTMKRMGWIVGALACLALGAAASSGSWAPVRAQDKYPIKPVKIVVPYGPGGATDIVTRIVAEQMRQSLGQSFVVENKPGAFGIVAIQEMMNARPDGYTLMVGNVSTNAITPVIVPERLKVNYARDVVPVTNLIDVPAFLVVTNTNFAPKNVAELIAYAKKNPGKTALRHRRRRQLSALRHGVLRQARRRSRHGRHPQQAGRRRRHQRHDDRRRAGRVPQRRLDGGADQGRQAPADRGGQPDAAAATIRTCRP